MAIPKTLKKIDEKKARKIIDSHPEGFWEGNFMDSDFIYEGRMMKNGYRRNEMVRAVRFFNGMIMFEHGVCSC